MQSLFDGDVVYGLEKAEAVLACVHNSLVGIAAETGAGECDREAVVGAGHIIFELRFAVREMALALKRQSTHEGKK